MKNSRGGVIYIFIAAFLFSTGGLFIKLIPWSAMAINGARSLISVGLIGLYMFLAREKFSITPGVILGGVATFFTCFLFILSNKLTTAANAIILQFTAPVFLIGFMAIFFKEKPKRLDIVTCVLVLCGIVCFFLDGMSTGRYLGDALALISGISYAGVFLMNRLPGASPISSVLLGHALCAVIGAPAIFQETDFSGMTMLWVVLLGVFQLGFGYICLCRGLKSVAPVTSSLITGIEPILSPILVMVFIPGMETLSPLAIVGGILVVATVIGYNFLQSRQLRIAKEE